MPKDKSGINMSDNMATALEDLERIELDFLIEEPKANKIEGRLVAFMGENGEKPD